MDFGKFQQTFAVLNPNIPECAVPIREVSVYFGLTPLIHYYYQKNKRPATRKDSLAFFEADNSIPQNIKDAVRTIYISKERGSADFTENAKLLSASYKVIEYVTQVFQKDLKTPNYVQDFSWDEHSETLSKVLGRPVIVSGKVNFFNESSFENVLAFLKNKVNLANDYTPDEFVETVRFLIENKDVKSVTKLYFFDKNSYRPFNQTDFGNLNINSFLYGWERSISTYVQRLNEYYLNSKSLSATDLKLAESLTACAQESYNCLCKTHKQLPSIPTKFLNSALSDNEKYFAYLKQLTEIGKTIKNNYEKEEEISKKSIKYNCVDTYEMSK